MKDNSATFKPSSSGVKKGRKRQLTDEADNVTSQPSSSSLSSAPADLSCPPPASIDDEYEDNNNMEQSTEVGYPGIVDLDHSSMHQDQENSDNDIVHTAAEALVIFSNRDSNTESGGAAGHSRSAGQEMFLCRGSTPAHSKEEEEPSRLMLPDDLKQNLECPVCTRISLPPIMQCRNGHVTCNPCRLKVQSCPMCREIDIDIRWVIHDDSDPSVTVLNLFFRNLFAEKAVTFMSIPCEYKTHGCTVEIQYKDKEVVRTRMSFYLQKD